MSLRSELERQSPKELIETLITWLFKPEFRAVYWNPTLAAEEMRVPILIQHFETEIVMSGILGFIDNPHGLYFSETAEAFERIGASETAGILRDIQQTMKQHGITHERLRADFANIAPYEVTTFAKIHGELGTMPQEVLEQAEALYLYKDPRSGEDVGALVDAFIERNRTAFINEFVRLAGE